MALPCQSHAGVSGGSNGFAVPKLYGCIGITNVCVKFVVVVFVSSARWVMSIVGMVES